MTIESSIDLDQPLWGVKEIAPIIRRSPRQAYELLEKGLIPAKKCGKTWVTTRRRLRALGEDQ
jgi:hypothetical protein